MPLRLDAKALRTLRAWAAAWLVLALCWAQVHGLTHRVEHAFVAGQAGGQHHDHPAAHEHAHEHAHGHEGRDEHRHDGGETLADHDAGSALCLLLDQLLHADGLAAAGLPPVGGVQAAPLPLAPRVGCHRAAAQPYQARAPPSNPPA